MAKKNIDSDDREDGMATWHFLGKECHGRRQEKRGTVTRHKFLGKECQERRQEIGLMESTKKMEHQVILWGKNAMDVDKREDGWRQGIIFLGMCAMDGDKK